MPSPKEVIENIRKTRFGIGLDTKNQPEDIQAYIEDSREFREEASRLVRDIYTKKLQFVFELIQNAEDNDYEKGEAPKIKFIARPTELVIQNNEKGFIEENVDKLCKIGGSTKRNALGYIGEKGIGFKSVFRVTNGPCIYSNGFQFMFEYDEKDPESIIRPQWVDKIPDFVDTAQTNIILPIKPDAISEIRQCIDQIQPSLLLFLRKLRIIEIENKNQDTHKKNRTT